MTKIKPQEVGSIIRWHDGAAIGRNYDHCDMHVKYWILVASWKSFKKKALLALSTATLL